LQVFNDKGMGRINVIYTITSKHTTFANNRAEQQQLLPTRS